MSFAQVQPAASGTPSTLAAASGNSVGAGNSTLFRATVKQVLSGDAVVVRGQPKNGPPPEKQLNLSHIIAPKLARRPTDSAPDSKDEPFAWEAREFLRQKLVGKEILFVVDYKVAASGREYGIIYLGKDTSGENVAEGLVSEGFVEVRQVTANRPQDEYLQRLNTLQDAAKASGKGKWGSPEVLQQHVRDIRWTLPATESPRNFVDSFRKEPVKAVIEYVRDGSTVRAFLLPSFHYVTVSLAGIKCPGFKVGDDGRVNTQDTEAFAEEAKYFTEVRLLQKDVEIILEGVSNQNFLGSILHPNGNIAEALLKEGYAKCVDWSIAVVSSGAEKYRAAEKVAKEKRLRVWKSYQPSTTHHGDSSAVSNFTGKVVEVVMGDALVVKTDKGNYQKIWLSSIRPPRAEDAGGKDSEQRAPGRQFRPLYDIPFMFEAREFLRKRLIGKKVQVAVDYIQPASQTANQQFPERMCCTVRIGDQNVAEALVSKGLATVVRYRQGDENRSSQYDLLLASEAKAEKTRKGLHCLKRDGTEGAVAIPKDVVPIVRVQELQGDAAKSKQFFPFLQRAGRTSAVVEFVASGSRFRLYVPKETCLLTFLLSGISCPRASRSAAPGGGPQTQQYDAQPFGDEALVFVKELCLQQEVEFETETLDKAGNFVGYMFVSDPSSGGSQKNLSIELVEHGLATVHFTAERSHHCGALKAAEERARSAKRGLWSLAEYQRKHEDDEENENAEKQYENGNVGDAAEEKDKVGGGSPASNAERPAQERKAIITEVLPDLRFYAQLVDQGPKLEQMMTDLRQELTNQPPLPGAYNPKRGDVCAARFSADNQWYRARVELIKSREHVELLYIDFGNREVTSTAKLAALPSSYHHTPPGAREFRLALVQLHPDADYAQLAVDHFNSELWLNGQQQEVLLNVEYRDGGIEHVTVVRPSPAEAAVSGSASDTVSADLGKRLIANGLAVVGKRRPGGDRRLASLLSQYQEAQETAKKSRLNIWQYGDFTGDEL